MMQRGMNERIRRLREQSENTPPRLSLERADLETDVYIKYEGTVSVPELRALTLKHVMENKVLCINDGELIVGEKGDGPQSAPTFPELCCHTLEDMHVMNDRELISFKGIGVRSEAAKGKDHSVLAEPFHPPQDSGSRHSKVEGVLRKRHFYRVYGAARPRAHRWLREYFPQRLFGAEGGDPAGDGGP